jgi:integrase
VKKGKQKHNISEKFIQNKLKADGLYFDEHEKGFGVRRQNGIVTFFLNYSFQGREHRATLGDPSRRRWPEFTVAEAVQVAKDMRHQMSGERKSDPLSVREAERTAPLVSELCDRYLTDYAIPNKRKNSVRDDRYMLDRVIRPKFGHMRVAAVTRRDVEHLHNSYRAKPYYANRILSLMSTMWNLAKEWGWATDNPAHTSKKGIKGIKPFEEHQRKPWLTDQQVNALETALAEHEDQDIANALRLILFTGSRHSEVLTAKWSDFALDRTPAIWTKPSHSNKRKRDVTVPLNRLALAALASIKRKDGSEYLFPGERKEHLWSLRKTWYEIRKAAKLPNLHIHDIRHHFGNTLVSEGATLYEVQNLLGHANPATTVRYAKIADQRLQEASQRFDKAFDRATTATVQ